MKKKFFLEAPSGGRINFRMFDIFLEAPSGGRINFRILDILDILDILYAS